MPPRRPGGFARRLACLLVTLVAVLAALFAPAADAQTYVSIVLAVDGQCSDYGRCQITTQTKCNQAAAAVGLPSAYEDKLGNDSIAVIAAWPVSVCEPCPLSV